MELFKLMADAIDKDFDAIHSLADKFCEQGKLKDAALWLEYACENNDDVAQYRLGVMCTEDETSPVYNLAKGNAMLAQSAYLGNNNARLYFAKHIFKNAPEKMHERAVRMLLDAYEDGVDEAIEILDDFLAAVADVDAEEPWKSTVSFELMKKAADLGSLNAIELCGLALIGNREFILFDENPEDYSEGMRYLEKAANLHMPVSSLFYCKVVIMALEKLEDGESVEVLADLESKCRLVFLLKKVVLDNFNFEEEFNGFCAMYSDVLKKLIEVYRSQGDAEKEKDCAERLKLLGTDTAVDDAAESEKDGEDDIKTYLDDAMLTNGVNIDEKQARVFRIVLKRKYDFPPEYKDKLIVCYVSYIALVKEDASEIELLEAKAFLSEYSNKGAEEYAQLMQCIEQKLN